MKLREPVDDHIVREAVLRLPDGRQLKLDVIDRDDLARLTAGMAAGAAVAVAEPPAKPATKRKPSGDPGEWLTVQQVAEILKISPDSVYELRYSGLVSSSKRPNVGVRFRRSDVEAYMRPDNFASNAAQAAFVRPRRQRRTHDDEEVLPGLSRAELKKIAGF